MAICQVVSGMCLEPQARMEKLNVCLCTGQEVRIIPPDKKTYQQDPANNREALMHALFSLAQQNVLDKHILCLCPGQEGQTIPPSRNISSILFDNMPGACLQVRKGASFLLTRRPISRTPPTTEKP